MKILQINRSTNLKFEIYRKGDDMTQITATRQASKPT